MKNNGSNGSSKSKWDKVTERSRGATIGKQTRLTGKAKEVANKMGGGSVSARLADLLEKEIGKPVKVKDKEWYVYNGVIWELTEGGRGAYKSKALDIQDSSNRNVR